MNAPQVEEPPFTNEVQIGSLPLYEGFSMVFWYDFGDDWKFDVKLERIDPVEPELSESQIIDSKGDAPDQYPCWDEDE